MTTDDLQLLLAGATILGYLAIATFFVRFWTRTRDRLFAWFAAAFLTLAIERVLLVSNASLTGGNPAVYLVRLLAFVFIAVALIEKNRQP